MREGILDEKEIEALEAEVDREILEATDRALAADCPPRNPLRNGSIRRMSIRPRPGSNRSRIRPASPNHGGDGSR